MPKVTLDMSTFKALASDTRLDILKALDGGKLSLKDICRVTKLNKATLHEHLTKLNEAGLVKKKEREGHKWVYYKLTWKGEGLLHPENTRIVVLFSSTFIAIAAGIIQIINFIKGKIVAKAINPIGSDSTLLYNLETNGVDSAYRTLDTIADKGGPAIEQAPLSVPSVPLVNQTNSELSNALLENYDIRGALQNKINIDSIEWKVADYNVFGRLNETKKFVIDSLEDYGGTDGDPGSLLGSEGANIFTDGASNVPSHMVAYVHDPALQWIAIACIVIAGVLLTIGIWRYWQNRKPRI